MSHHERGHDISQNILCTNLFSLKGNYKENPSHVIMNTCDKIPQDLISRHGIMAIAVDNMYINGRPFFITISRNIHFGTAELIKTKKL